ncbi:hypothetical protein L218DRAFT_1003935 [Marasmius fiardii PR-910]|nr:hypothetical protein L218DRAFT_1003935 [Marasmius fiardii PR-910]
MADVMGKIRTTADELEHVHDDRPSDNQIIATMLSACAEHSEFRSIISTLEAAKDIQEERARLTGGVGDGVLATAAMSTTKATLKCSNCTRVGHSVENCFHPGGGKEGQFPEWYFKKKVESSGSTTAGMAMVVAEKTYAF